MITNQILNAMFNNEEHHKIIAYFRNGNSATYTTNILNLLKTDPDVIDIIDAETGEIIFTR